MGMVTMWTDLETEDDKAHPLPSWEVRNPEPKEELRLMPVDHEDIAGDDIDGLLEHYHATYNHDGIQIAMDDLTSLTPIEVKDFEMKKYREFTEHWAQAVNEEVNRQARYAAHQSPPRPGELFDVIIKLGKKGQKRT